MVLQDPDGSEKIFRPPVWGELATFLETGRSILLKQDAKLLLLFNRTRCSAAINVSSSWAQMLFRAESENKLVHGVLGVSIRVGYKIAGWCNTGSYTRL